MLDQFILGFVAGLRSQMPLAVLALQANRRGAELPAPLGILRSHSALGILGSAAVGELLIDKLPFLPNRTDPAPLVGRITFGALAGFVASRVTGNSAIVGAAAGALGGLAGSFVGYSVRSELKRHTPWPDVVPAALEDALAVALAWEAAGRVFQIAEVV